jgi:hypothetical protein
MAAPTDTTSYFRPPSNVSSNLRLTDDDGLAVYLSKKGS